VNLVNFEIKNRVDNLKEILPSRPSRQGIRPYDTRERMFILAGAGIGIAGTYSAMKAWERWGERITSPVSKIADRATQKFEALKSEGFPPFRLKEEDQAVTEQPSTVKEDAFSPMV
jgi:hypothetical protein